MKQGGQMDMTMLSEIHRRDLRIYSVSIPLLVGSEGGGLQWVKGGGLGIFSIVGSNGQR